MRKILILGLLVVAMPALAEARNVAIGRRIAEPCKACHAIGVKGKSPDAHALPFRSLARKYPLENLQEGFAEGIVVGHSDGMPGFRLTPGQIEAFLAYLKSIQR
jgi:cytochrome c